MGNAAKRARKRENQAKGREAREAAEKRSKQKKRGGQIAIVVVAIVAVVMAIYFLGGDDKKKTASTTTVNPVATTSTLPTTSTTAKLAAGCVDTTPAKTGNGKQYQAVGDAKIDPAKKYTATFETTCGTFTAELDAKNSPKGVNNFVYLAREGFFDGLTWHRVVKDFVIQGGDPTGTGSGGPGYKTPTELPTSDYKTGDLAWALSDAEGDGDAGSQFFVVTGNPGGLNATPGKTDGHKYRYGYFGTVTSGLDVAQKLESYNNGGDTSPPTHPLYILKVTISES